MFYYILLIIATLFFALSFYFNKKVEQNCHNSIDTTILFLTVTWFEVFAVLFIVLKGKIGFSWFSFACAAVHSVFLAIFTLLNLKALKTVDLSKYSLYTMLGGMLVPAAYGILFVNEGLTIGKAVCYILVTLALIFESGSTEKNKGELKILLSVFLVNGIFGVISAFHQNSSLPHLNSMEYMGLLSLIISAFGGLWLLVQKIKGKRLNAVKNKKAYLNMLCYGAFYGGAEFILLIAIKHIASSVQFPIITGATIVFSTIIGAISGESKTKKSVAALVIAIIGLLFLMVK